MATAASGLRSLVGKVAVVTGSTSGIGLEIARRLGQDGANVMVSSRKVDHVENAVQELAAEKLAVAGTVCHVGKAEDRSNLIQKAMSKYGGIDILVSSAAVNPTSSIGPILNIFDVNVKATFLLCKEVVPCMRQRGGGSIVFVSSYVGIDPLEVPIIGAYAVSKTALLGLTKALVPQLADMNIRVNSVVPGLIQTPFSEVLWSHEDRKQAIMNRVPLRRLGEASELAGLVSYLASDDASYITGENIIVSGGMPGRL